MKRAHIVVSGRVQGVSFRAHTVAMARNYGVQGWVENMEDGRVEILAEGQDEAVDKLIAWCHEGPGAARVEHVEVEWQPYQGNLGRFHIEF